MNYKFLRKGIKTIAREYKVEKLEVNDIYDKFYLRKFDEYCNKNDNVENHKLREVSIQSLLLTERYLKIYGK